MENKDEEAQKERARRLRGRIDDLKQGKAPKKEAPAPKTPRDFIHDKTPKPPDGDTTV